MAASSNSLSQAANAQLGIALPLMYGYCRVRGDNILLNQSALGGGGGAGTGGGYRTAFYILGEGEWDGIERLWINKRLVNTGDATLVHFHPGRDGTLGAGLAPASNGGDQAVDNFFSKIPGNFQPLTYSRKAYLAVNVPPDPRAPDANLDVIGDYRCCKVRIFDSSANQTAYQFSTNGAWQVLDLILRKILNPEWTIAAAAAAGGDLTADQKARINFPAVVSAAAWCDTVLANGQKRFESSVAFVSTIKLQQALAQLLTMSQLYITEEAGQIFILPDQPRSSTFLMTTDHVVAGTASFDKVDLHGSANRIIASFNDLNPQDNADIDTVANSGLVRAGNVVTVQTKAVHPFVPGDQVQICPPTDGSTHDTSFDGVYPVASVPDSTHLTYAQTGANATSGNGYCGTPESRFAQRASVVDHERHQNALGNRGLRLNALYRKLPLNIDLGNNTMERTQRVLSFIKNRNLGVDTTPYSAPWTCKISAYLDAVDAQTRSLVEQLCGDIITIDSTISEEFQGDYEIKKKTVNLGALGTAKSSGSGATTDAPVIELELLQYLPAAFGDPIIIAQKISSSPARGNLPPQLISDNLVRNGDFSAGALNWTDISGGPVQFLTNISGLPRGSAELKVTLSAGLSQPTSIELIPVDFAKTYLMEAWIKITGSSAQFWAGLAEYDLNGQIFNHILAGAFRAWGLVSAITSTTGWQYFAAEFNGNGGTNPGPNQFNAAAAYISAVFFMQWNSGAPVTLEVCGVRLSEVAAGAKRATSGLQASGQLQGTFKSNPVNANGLFTGGNPLTQQGTGTTILVAASTQQFGDGQVSYNSGSVNPGAYGTWFVYADDPTFAGGAVTYQVTASASTQTAANGRVGFGRIITSSGGGGSGSGGGGGACFSGNTRVRTPRWFYRTALAFHDLPDRVRISTVFGPRWARVIRRQYTGWMHDMGNGELVTPPHRILRQDEMIDAASLLVVATKCAAFFDAEWLPASDIWPERVWVENVTVFTLEIETERDEERHFILGNGRVAHNLSNF